MRQSVRLFGKRFATDVKVKGIKKGYQGLLNEEIIDMDARRRFGYHPEGRYDSVILRVVWNSVRPEPDRKRARRSVSKHGIDGLVVIGGDGSFRGAQAAVQHLESIRSVLPGTIDLDIACTEYTIGFDTAVNTAMQAIDKVRDTSYFT